MCNLQCAMYNEKTLRKFFGEFFIKNNILCQLKYKKYINFSDFSKKHGYYK